MKTSDFNFELPQELIAQTPIPRRDASRLLVLDKDTGAWEHRHFYDLPDYLRLSDPQQLPCSPGPAAGSSAPRRRSL